MKLSSIELKQDNLYYYLIFLFDNGFRCELKIRKDSDVTHIHRRFSYLIRELRKGDK